MNSIQKVKKLLNVFIINITINCTYYHNLNNKSTPINSYNIHNTYCYTLFCYYTFIRFNRCIVLRCTVRFYDLEQLPQHKLCKPNNMNIIFFRP